MQSEQQATEMTPPRPGLVEVRKLAYERFLALCERRGIAQPSASLAFETGFGEGLAAASAVLRADREARDAT